MSCNVSKMLNMKILSSIKLLIKVLISGDLNYFFYVLTNRTFDGYTSMLSYVLYLNFILNKNNVKKFISKK